MAPDRPAGKRYAFGIIAAGIALLVNWIGWGLFDGMPYTVPTIAVAVTLLYGGIGPACVVAVSAFISTEFFLMNPGLGFAHSSWFRIALITVHTYVAMILRREWEKSDQAKRDAEAALKSRDQFMTIAAHEFKTPISSMKMQVEMMLRKCTDESSRHRLEVLKRQADRMNDLVNNLLDVSKIVTNRFQMDPSEVNLSEVIQEVVTRQAELFLRSACDVTLELQPRIYGRWDRLRVEQIITNLLSNSCKYGGGKPISVRTWGDEEWAYFQVQDNGIGIAKEDQKRIFDQFQRAVSERNYGGLGLGLWITHQIVKAKGGDISVDSEPSKGSIFTIRLPRYRTPNAEEHLEEEPTHTSDGCKAPENTCPTSSTPSRLRT